MYSVTCPRCNNTFYSAAKDVLEAKCYFCAYPLKKADIVGAEIERDKKEEVVIDD